MRLDDFSGLCGCGDIMGLGWSGYIMGLGYIVGLGGCGYILGLGGCGHILGLGGRVSSLEFVEELGQVGQDGQAVRGSNLCHILKEDTIFSKSGPKYFLKFKWSAIKLARKFPKK